jgi:phenylacetate-CoA ligase
MQVTDRFRRAKVELYCTLKGQRRFRYYRSLLANERLNAAALADIQWQHLQRILEQAYRTVPFYRQVFDDRGILPKDIAAPSDLAHLPVLTRARIREHRNDLLSHAVTPDRVFPHSTGGSTGEPLDFYRGYEHNEFANFAGDYRSFHRAGWEPGERMAWIWGHPVEARDSAQARAPGLKRRLGNWMRDFGFEIFDAFDAGPERMGEWVDRFRRYRFRYVHGYASALAHFARYLESNDIELRGVAGVISTAEPLYPDQRSLLTRVFGAPVIDKYGSREVPSIATGCHRGRMHINTDLVYLEFAEAPGDGATKRMIVTDLHNTTFPFIRYDIGDCAAPLPDRCECGRPFPLMTLTIGRAFDNFRSPEGRVVHGAFFKNLMDGVPGIEQFQFRQTSPSTVLLLLKKSATYGAATEAHLRHVRERMRSDFSQEARLVTEYVDAIRQTNQGKYRYTISCVVPEMERPA